MTLWTIQEPLTPGSILQTVADCEGVSVESIRSTMRTARVSQARDIACLLIRRRCRLTLHELGRFISRDHSSVHYAIRRCDKRMSDDAEFSEHVRRVSRAVESSNPLSGLPPIPTNDPDSARWETLRWATIVGIVDSYGAVHSRMFPIDSPTSDMFHEAIFGTKGHCAWRWSFSDCITWITPEMKPDAEQHDAIRRHLTRKHGLEWWENGHHDIDHFLQRLSDEQNVGRETRPRHSATSHDSELQ